MERETGFEPATSTLARSHSTTELLPLSSRHYKRATKARQTSEGNLGALRSFVSKGSRAVACPVPVLRSGGLAFVVARPLGILLGRHNLPIPHVDDLIAVFGSLRIVRDHQDRLAKFAIRLPQHTEHDR